jgi:hypothetical protein
MIFRRTQTRVSRYLRGVFLEPSKVPCLSGGTATRSELAPPRGASIERRQAARPVSHLDEPSQLLGPVPAPAAALPSPRRYGSPPDRHRCARL